MDEGDLMLIRAQVLHDLGELAPDYYEWAVGKIGQGRADWMLGRMLAKKKSSMTHRQALACQVLLMVGLYRVTADALAERNESRASRQSLPEERAGEEAEFRKLTNNALFFEYQLREYLTLYAAQLPKNKGRSLTSLIVIEGYEPGSIALGGSNHVPVTAPAADPVESRLAELFDPLSRAGIAALFNMIDKETWRAYFERAARNGLIYARQLGPTAICYNPFHVGEWLIKHNADCTQSQIDRKLANNLPRRSKGMKALFTGEVD
ncbi:hypothetical protein [Nitrosovibrio sp. Nv4]|uniref:hypothetical protein n=1 Tax=Nitrosovibrio sp. Nv4 TaxID=1945880 RepID=UPI000BDD1673|nr:hypothetical protein [Nitrosovibrio sp. Nv4]SOD42224.1 hypothetical protein SAMN06298226_2557 [Nitrosovibrio sp. Nv4]